MAYQFYSKIRGVTFGNAQQSIENLFVGQELDVVREPDNPYDKNAIALYATGKLIGHLSKEIAKDLAPCIDHGGRYRVIVKNITGSYGQRGVNIFVEECNEC